MLGWLLVKLVHLIVEGIDLTLRYGLTTKFVRELCRTCGFTKHMFSSFALPFELLDLLLDVRNFSFKLLVLEQLITKTDTKLTVKTQVNLWLSFISVAN